MIFEREFQHHPPTPTYQISAVYLNGSNANDDTIIFRTGPDLGTIILMVYTGATQLLNVLLRHKMSIFRIDEKGFS